jgi:hypothetical protein
MSTADLKDVASKIKRADQDVLNTAPDIVVEHFRVVAEFEEALVQHLIQRSKSELIVAHQMTLEFQTETHGRWPTLSSDNQFLVSYVKSTCGMS